MPAPAPTPLSRKPILGAYRPDPTTGRCLVCDRHRHLCSASCRVVARRLRPPPKKRIRHTQRARLACDIAELSAATRQLITIGQALHGQDWKRPTARDVGVDVKRIWRWLHGQGRPTTNDVLSLLEVARRRIEAISQARNEVLHQLPGRPVNKGDFPQAGSSRPPDRPHLRLWKGGR